MRRRPAIILGAAAVGGLFLAGLFVSGPLGGALLAVTAVILAGLSTLTWSQLRPQGRPLRVVVVAVVAALAVVKLTHG